MKKPIFNTVSLIRKKRDGEKLEDQEITYLISEYTKYNIQDYQIAAFLMAVYFQGMDFNEITQLMKAMMNSGKILDLKEIKMPVIDKHSTGGVGDKVSLILAPLMASCSICIPMISGRGLGHTGGTLDKLESIPGFRTNLTLKEFKHQLKRLGVAMIGQTGEIAPADKKFYALRDVTATVDSIPLIAASIMSKKIAEDLDGLVLDVKFGSGAFMASYTKAKKLAQTMIQIGKRAGIKITAVLTDMNNPLGAYVGNSLEVMETIEALKGNGSEDLMQVTYALAGEMLKLAKIKGGKKLLKRKIIDGSALDNFKKLVCAQKGDIFIFNDYSRLPIAKKISRVYTKKSGYVHKIDCYQIGILLVEMGGGRSKKEDDIDPSCGFKINKKIGDKIKKNDCLIEVFCNDPVKARTIKRKLQDVFVIRDKPCQHVRMVREILH